ncbi:MAG: hypothetical protein V1704_04340 [Candidatus Vogelbacteria bacterium]
MIRRLLSCLAVGMVGMSAGCWRADIDVHRPSPTVFEPVVFESDTDPVNDVGGDNYTGGDSTIDVVGDVVVVGNVTGDIVDLPDNPPPPAPVPPPPPPAPVCGNWVIEAGEQCDRANFGDHGCFGYGGYLVCTANCRINYDQCTRPPPPPVPPPPPPEPTVLTASITQPENASEFRKDELFTVTVVAFGAVKPYRLKCFLPDRTFFPNPIQTGRETEEMDGGTISFNDSIGKVGTGELFCQVTSADNQTVNLSTWITVW